jgi:3-phenylpropionate/trans-cinnamate dioxygenase ferredoxin reductase subunit
MIQTCHHGADEHEGRANLTREMSSSSQSDTVLIVGAGQAGGQCAVSLRRQGWTGPIILAGSEPHPPYQRPPLSKAYLSGEMDEERLWLQSLETWAEQNVELKLGATAIAVDRTGKRVKFQDGSEQAYSKLVLATGSRPRPLPVPGADLDGVRYLRTIQDVDALKSDFSPGKRIAIIGGGYIGLEAAAVAKKLGAEPVVIEAMDRLLARVAVAELSRFYLEAHKTRGVDVRLGASVKALKGASGHVDTVCLADGQIIRCDSVLVGIGVVPNQEIAENCQLKIGNGICVDEDCRTRDPDIFAIGDCAEGVNPVFHRRLRLESVPNALEQAKLVSAKLCGAALPRVEAPWFWSDQFNLKLQSAGLVDGSDTCVMRGDYESEHFALFHLANGVLIAADAINDPHSFMAAKLMIAAGTKPDPDALANKAIPIKETMKAALAMAAES